MLATCSIARRSSRKDRLFACQDAQRVNIAWNGRALRFGVFHQDGIALVIGGETKEITETVAQSVAYIAVLPVVIVAVGFGAWLPAGRAAPPSPKQSPCKQKQFPRRIFTDGLQHRHRRKSKSRIKHRC